MAIGLGEEFKLQATPGPELRRKLDYLAAQDNDSVMTGAVRSPRRAYSATTDKAAKTADMVMMARLADPAYQAMSARINENLDLMDEASVRALQEIEEELAELRREREQMLDKAYRDEHGRAIFMTKDGTAAYYEDGTKVDDEKFAALKDELRDRPAWDRWEELRRRKDELSVERDDIHKHDAKRDELRDDLANGRISKEEAQRREREIEESQPARVRRSYDALRGRSMDDAPAPDAAAQSPEGDPETQVGPPSTGSVPSGPG